MSYKTNTIIKKANILINAHYKLNINEQKIIYKLISLIRVDDEEFKDYEIKIADLISFLDIKNNRIYQDIKKYVNNLMKEILVFKEGGKEVHIQWLGLAEYGEENRNIKFNFHPRLKPYLLNLQEEFTIFEIGNIKKFKSKYSPQVYEILKQCESFGCRKITIKELRKKLMLGNGYKNYNDFKKYILLKAQEEINLYSDIFFTFEEIKEGKKIVGIFFKIKSQRINKLKVVKKVEEPETIKQNEKIKGLIEKFNTKYTGKLDYILTKFLVDKKGFDFVEECINEFGNYVKNANEVERVFFDFTMKYGTEKAYIKNKAYHNNKPIQAMNYEQRQYDDDFFNSLYDNASFGKNEE